MAVTMAEMLGWMRAEEEVHEENVAHLISQAVVENAFFEAGFPTRVLIIKTLQVIKDRRREGYKIYQ